MAAAATPVKYALLLEEELQASEDKAKLLDAIVNPAPPAPSAVDVAVETASRLGQDFRAAVDGWKQMWREKFGDAPPEKTMLAQFIESIRDEYATARRSAAEKAQKKEATVKSDLKQKRLRFWITSFPSDFDKIYADLRRTAVSTISTMRRKAKTLVSVQDDPPTEQLQQLDFLVRKMAQLHSKKAGSADSAPVRELQTRLSGELPPSVKEEFNTRTRHAHTYVELLYAMERCKDKLEIEKQSAPTERRRGEKVSIQSDLRIIDEKIQETFQAYQTQLTSKQEEHATVRSAAAEEEQRRLAAALSEFSVHDPAAPLPAKEEKQTTDTAGGGLLADLWNWVRSAAPSSATPAETKQAVERDADEDIYLTEQELLAAAEAEHLSTVMQRFIAKAKDMDGSIWEAAHGKLRLVQDGKIEFRISSKTDRSITRSELLEIIGATLPTWHSPESTGEAARDEALKFAFKIFLPTGGHDNILQQYAKSKAFMNPRTGEALDSSHAQSGMDEGVMETSHAYKKLFSLGEYGFGKFKKTLLEKKSWGPPSGPAQTIEAIVASPRWKKDKQLQQFFKGLKESKHYVDCLYWLSRINSVVPMGEGATSPLYQVVNEMSSFAFGEEGLKKTLKGKAHLDEVEKDSHFHSIRLHVLKQLNRYPASGDKYKKHPEAFTAVLDASNLDELLDALSELSKINAQSSNTGLKLRFGTENEKGWKFESRLSSILTGIDEALFVKKDGRLHPLWENHLITSPGYTDQQAALSEYQNTFIKALLECEVSAKERYLVYSAIKEVINAKDYDALGQVIRGGTASLIQDKGWKSKLAALTVDYDLLAVQYHEEITIPDISLVVCRVADTERTWSNFFEYIASQPSLTSDIEPSILQDLKVKAVNVESAATTWQKINLVIALRDSGESSELKALCNQVIGNLKNALLTGDTQLDRLIDEHERLTKAIRNLEKDQGGLLMGHGRHVKKIKDLKEKTATCVKSITDLLAGDTKRGVTEVGMHLKQETLWKALTILDEDAVTQKAKMELRSKLVPRNGIKNTLLNSLGYDNVRRFLVNAFSPSADSFSLKATPLSQKKAAFDVAFEADARSLKLDSKAFFDRMITYYSSAGAHPSHYAEALHILAQLDQFSFASVTLPPSTEFNFWIGLNRLTDNPSARRQLFMEKDIATPLWNSLNSWVDQEPRLPLSDDEASLYAKTLCYRLENLRSVDELQATLHCVGQLNATFARMRLTPPAPIVESLKNLYAKYLTIGDAFYNTYTRDPQIFDPFYFETQLAQLAAVFTHNSTQRPLLTQALVKEMLVDYPISNLQAFLEELKRANAQPGDKTALQATHRDKLKANLTLIQNSAKMMLLLEAGGEIHDLLRDILTHYNRLYRKTEVFPELAQLREICSGDTSLERATQRVRQEYEGKITTLVNEAGAGRTPDLASLTVALKNTYIGKALQTHLRTTLKTKYLQLLNLNPIAFPQIRRLTALFGPLCSDAPSWQKALDLFEKKYRYQHSFDLSPLDVSGPSAEEERQAAVVLAREFPDQNEAVKEGIVASNLMWNKVRDYYNGPEDAQLPPEVVGSFLNPSTQEVYVATRAAVNALLADETVDATKINKMGKLLEILKRLPNDAARKAEVISVMCQNPQLLFDTPQLFEYCWATNSEAVKTAVEISILAQEDQEVRKAHLITMIERLAAIRWDSPDSSAAIATYALQLWGQEFTFLHTLPNEQINAQMQVLIRLWADILQHSGNTSITRLLNEIALELPRARKKTELLSSLAAAAYEILNREPPVGDFGRVATFYPYFKEEHQQNAMTKILVLLNSTLDTLTGQGLTQADLIDQFVQMLIADLKAGNFDQIEWAQQQDFFQQAIEKLDEVQLTLVKNAFRDKIVELCTIAQDTGSQTKDVASANATLHHIETQHPGYGVLAPTTEPKTMEEYIAAARQAVACRLHFAREGSVWNLPEFLDTRDHEWQRANHTLLSLDIAMQKKIPATIERVRTSLARFYEGADSMPINAGSILDIPPVRLDPTTKGSGGVKKGTETAPELLPDDTRTLYQPAVESMLQVIPSAKAEDAAALRKDIDTIIANLFQIRFDRPQKGAVSLAPNPDEAEMKRRALLLKQRRKPDGIFNFLIELGEGTFSAIAPLERRDSNASSMGSFFRSTSSVSSMRSRLSTASSAEMNALISKIKAFLPRLSEANARQIAIQISTDYTELLTDAISKKLAALFDEKHRDLYPERSGLAILRGDDKKTLAEAFLDAATVYGSDSAVRGPKIKVFFEFMTKVHEANSKLLEVADDGTLYGPSVVGTLTQAFDNLPLSEKYNLLLAYQQLTAGNLDADKSSQRKHTAFLKILAAVGLGNSTAGLPKTYEAALTQWKASVSSEIQTAFEHLVTQANTPIEAANREREAQAAKAREAQRAVALVGELDGLKKKLEIEQRQAAESKAKSDAEAASRQALSERLTEFFNEKYASAHREKKDLKTCFGEIHKAYSSTYPDNVFIQFMESLTDTAKPIEAFNKKILEDKVAILQAYEDILHKNRTTSGKKTANKAEAFKTIVQAIFGEGVESLQGKTVTELLKHKRAHSTSTVSSSSAESPSPTFQYDNAALDAVLHTVKLRRAGVAGDGNCFFHALALLLPTPAINILKTDATPYTAVELRALGCQAVREAFAISDNFFVGETPEARTAAMEAYVLRMGRDREYADGNIIAALAMKLGFTIRTYEQRWNKQRTELQLHAHNVEATSGEGKPQVNLLLIQDAVHYEALLPALEAVHQVDPNAGVEEEKHGSTNIESGDESSSVESNPSTLTGQPRDELHQANTQPVRIQPPTRRGGLGTVDDTKSHLHIPEGSSSATRPPSSAAAGAEDEKRLPSTTASLNPTPLRRAEDPEAPVRPNPAPSGANAQPEAKPGAVDPQVAAAAAAVETKAQADAQAAERARIATAEAAQLDSSIGKALTRLLPEHRAQIGTILCDDAQKRQLLEAVLQSYLTEIFRQTKASMKEVYQMYEEGKGPFYEYMPQVIYGDPQHADKYFARQSATHQWEILSNYRQLVMAHKADSGWFANPTQTQLTQLKGIDQDNLLMESVTLEQSGNIPIKQLEHLVEMVQHLSETSKEELGAKINELSPAEPVVVPARTTEQRDAAGAGALGDRGTASVHGPGGRRTASGDTGSSPVRASVAEALIGSASGMTPLGAKSAQPTVVDASSGVYNTALNPLHPDDTALASPEQRDSAIDATTFAKAALVPGSVAQPASDEDASKMKPNPLGALGYMSKAV